MKKEKKLFRHINIKDLNNYELENKRLSYKNLFYNDENLFLCNNVSKHYDELELTSGNDYDEENDEYLDVYQYYLIDDDTATRLQKINELIYYDNYLDCYVLGVCHYGTSWSYILTDIEIEKSEDDTWYNCYYYEEKNEVDYE